MPLYLYSARDAQGALVHGKQEAASEAIAVKVLQGRNLLITRIVEAGADLRRSAERKKKRHRGVKLSDLLFFIRQTAVLLDAGIPLLRAIGMLSPQLESQRLFTAVEKIREDMKAGTTFKDALASHPKVFPPVWAFLIEAGEASGNLPFVLNQLADHLESSIELKKKITSAFVYPSVLIFLSLAAVLVFLLKIIPIFSKLFANFNAKLPPLTLAVIAVSDFVRAYIVYLFIASVLGVIALRRYLATDEGKRQRDKLLISLPVFGELVRDSVQAAIAMNLATLVKSGVNLLHSLEITARASGNAVYETALENTALDIQQGKTLGSSMGESSLFSPIMVHMIMTGEESGRLADMLDRVSKYYQARVDVFLGRLGTLIEPLVLIIVGGFVGILVVSMFLPIFSLSSVIK